MPRGKQDFLIKNFGVKKAFSVAGWESGYKKTFPIFEVFSVAELLLNMEILHLLLYTLHNFVSVTLYFTRLYVYLFFHAIMRFASVFLYFPQCCICKFIFHTFLYLLLSCFISALHLLSSCFKAFFIFCYALRNFISETSYFTRFYICFFSCYNAFWVCYFLHNIIFSLLVFSETNFTSIYPTLRTKGIKMLKWLHNMLSLWFVKNRLLLLPPRTEMSNSKQTTVRKGTKNEMF